MLSLAQIPAQTVRRRRLSFALLCSFVFLVGFVPMVSVLAHGGFGLLDALILAFFMILFGQVSFGFTLALVGFWTLWKGGDPLRISRTVPPEGLSGPLPSTAIVMPIFNEDPGRVFQGVRVMMESLRKTGRSEGFDFFVLSDSNDSNNWIEEERSWLELCRDLDAFGRIFYRKRRIQLHQKSGNIADFCRRWGANYRYMIVLDADSIMQGPTLVRLVELMERNRSVGIIQTAPQLALGTSLFRRIQQFAARLYGPIFMAGAHFWHLGGGNYWGHNAIIRLKLFMDHCALPELPKIGPVGGRILSHDTIEAAFMRRAGYAVWVAYDLDGSYEESPPDLVASLQRDRRWCQGNIQHLLVLFRRGLRFSSRVHILLGIMSYASAPLWLLSILLTTVAALMAILRPPMTNDAVPRAVWQEPVYVSGALFAYVFFLLLAPKFLGALNWSRVKGGLAAFGGAGKVLLSMLTEIVFSMLLAPILMMFYTKFVFASLTGMSVKWGRQNRGEERPSWRQLTSLLGTFTAFGILAWGAAGWLAPELTPWLIPVFLGLAVSIPFARITSSSKLGQAARANGWFMIPEETIPPPELAALEVPPPPRESPFFRQPGYADHYGLLQAVLDPYIHAIHVSLLRLREQVSEKTRGHYADLRSRLLADGPSSLTTEERNNLLWDAEALIMVHKDLWISPDSGLDRWWQQALRHYNEATEIATRRSVAGPSS